MASAVVALAGCSFHGPTSLPLPGGIGGSGTYHVTILLDDASNLVTHETCRSNDVTIGSISAISVTPDLKAKVVCAIKDSVRLPANSTASLESASLLGERFLALGPATGQQAVGRLQPGAVIPDSGTHTDPDAEQVLGALAAVLNGGDLARISTISQELTEAMSGHQGDIRTLLTGLTSLTGQLSEHSSSITGALDALNRLSTTIAQQRTALGAALDTIPAGLKVLNDQRPELVATLQRVQALSRTAIPLIAAARHDATADLTLLQPTVNQLAVDGSHLATALRMLLNYPFPNDASVAVGGDYGGMYATVNLSVDTLTTLLQQELHPSSSTPRPSLADLLKGGAR